MSPSISENVEGLPLRRSSPPPVDEDAAVEIFRKTRTPQDAGCGSTRSRTSPAGRSRHNSSTAYERSRLGRACSHIERRRWSNGLAQEWSSLERAVPKRGRRARRAARREALVFGLGCRGVDSAPRNASASISPPSRQRSTGSRATGCSSDGGGCDPADKLSSPTPSSRLNKWTFLFLNSFWFIFGYLVQK